MIRERQAVQKLDTATVKKALRYCMSGECNSRCPLYSKSLICKKNPALLESALAIIERQESALIEYAERLKSHYPHTPGVRSTIDKELSKAVTS